MSDVDAELEKIRAIMKKMKGGRQHDQSEWRPDKASPNASLKWKFFFLPPVDSMTMWCYRHGYHFINNRSYECPRLHDSQSCPLCDYAFNEMQKYKDRESRSKIARALLPMAKYAVNIYFPMYETTPEHLRDKVMWFSMSQTVYDICEKVIFRDGPGDGPEPEPYGVFWNPEDAYPFILEARLKGEWNSYDASRFLPTKVPITKKGKEAINKILASRHDIPSKFESRNFDALTNIVKQLSGEIPMIVAQEQEGVAATGVKTVTSGNVTTIKHSAPLVVEKPKTKNVLESTEVELEPKEELETKPNEDASGKDDMEDDEELAALLSKLKKK